MSTSQAASAGQAASASQDLESPAWVFWAASLTIGGLTFAYLVMGLGLPPDAPTMAMAASVIILMVALRQLFRVVYALGFESAELWADAAVVVGGAASEQRSEYKRVLQAIKQLDEDFELGKLSTEDHKSLREGLTLRAVELKRGFSTADADQAMHPELDAQLQAEAPTTCPKCQTENDPDARFCKSCGAELGAAAQLQGEAQEAAPEPGPEQSSEESVEMGTAQA